MNKKTRGRNFAFYAVILLLLLVMLYSGFRILQASVAAQSPEETRGDTKTVIRDGVAYFPRQDITVVMVLGIDRQGPVQDSQSYNNKGAADLVMLLVFDETAQKCDILQLNRDTMLTMPVLGVGGKQAGTKFGQLALSHTYGSGLHDSSENTKNTLSQFLYGLRIDYYVTMNMDAIAILNDAVGGVTVEVEHDFSQVDPTIPMGTVTLTGEQALHFVRTRKDVGDQLNLTRIERQQEYMEGFVQAFRAKQAQGTDFILDVYEEVSPYLCSDCSGTVIRSLVDRFGGYEIRQMVSPEGENVMGEEYFEFYVDEEALDALILQLFYAPK